MKYSLKEYKQAARNRFGSEWDIQVQLLHWDTEIGVAAEKGDMRHAVKCFSDGRALHPMEMADALWGHFYG